MRLSGIGVRQSVRPARRRNFSFLFRTGKNASSLTLLFYRFARFCNAAGSVSFNVWRFLRRLCFRCTGRAVSDAAPHLTMLWAVLPPISVRTLTFQCCGSFRFRCRIPTFPYRRSRRFRYPNYRHPCFYGRIIHLFAGPHSRREPPRIFPRFIKREKA